MFCISLPKSKLHCITVCKTMSLSFFTVNVSVQIHTPSYPHYFCILPTTSDLQAFFSIILCPSTTWYLVKPFSISSRPKMGCRGEAFQSPLRDPCRLLSTTDPCSPRSPSEVDYPWLTLSWLHGETGLPRRGCWERGYTCESQPECQPIFPLQRHSGCFHCSWAKVLCPCLSSPFWPVSRPRSQQRPPLMTLMSLVTVLFSSWPCELSSIVNAVHLPFPTGQPHVNMIFSSNTTPLWWDPWLHPSNGTLQVFGSIPQSPFICFLDNASSKKKWDLVCLVSNIPGARQNTWRI